MKEEIGEEIAELTRSESGIDFLKGYIGFKKLTGKLKGKSMIPDL